MKNLKNQLLLIFSVFIIISILTAAFTAYYFKSNEKIKQLEYDISNLENEALKALISQENFFNFELSNSNYFESQQSKYLDTYQETYQKLQLKFQNIEQYPSIDSTTKNQLHHIQLE